MATETKRHPTLDGKVLSWAEDLDERTLAQAHTAAALPFVAKPLALMPDAHLGYGATIGSVIATRGAIIPSAVGVDLGCGMIAAQTGLQSKHLPNSLGPLHGEIRKRVPAGIPTRRDKSIGSHTDAQDLPGFLQNTVSDVAAEHMAKAAVQFGTLGSGNHFIEVCLDEQDRVWVMLHSGSRGVGNKLATHHIAKAKGLMKEWFITLDDPDLAYLVEGTSEFEAYIADMLWAQDYAAQNRLAMMDQVLAALQTVIGKKSLPKVPMMVNCHHNYATMEHHHGRNLWVTRKGAISAREGQLGIIPGSMATGSYIVRGLGSPASYTSASHGAGRRMSRSQARKTLTVESLRGQMGDRTWNDRDAEALLDEHPDAYKDIESVMADQADLVEPVHHLTQVLNFKGA